MLLLLAHGVNADQYLLRGAAQGTTYHIKYVAQPKTLDASRLHADVEKLLAEIDQQMSTYRPDSEVSRFNRAPANEWFAVSPATAKVVVAAQQISEKTGGALDITVGPLVRLWHFGPNSETNGPKKAEFQPPTEAAIDAIRKLVGYKKLDMRLSPPALRKQVDGLEIDLSSIASGYTIDRLASLLDQRRINNYMVELGGEIRAAGTRADGQPWRVAIERPMADKRELASAVTLANAALATAGGSRHFFEYAGRRYSHVIDPATGRPVEHTLASVTVAADTCLAADGWDTPLMVLGPRRGYECAEKYKIAALFIEHSDAGDADQATAAWRKRFGSD
jgi:FAD:protein FMN transferase